MPLTAKGEEIYRNLLKEYGSEAKAKQVLYAGKNAGTFTGIDADEGYGKPMAMGNGFEYWEHGGEVYRNAVGNRGPATKTGGPGNARWECSKPHFERFREVLLGKDEISEVGPAEDEMTETTTAEIRKVASMASCPFSVAAACYSSVGGNLEKAIQCAKKQWPNNPFGNRAKDARSARLHRALDSVLDKHYAKDASESTFTFKIYNQNNPHGATYVIFRNGVHYEDKSGIQSFGAGDTDADKAARAARERIRDLKQMGK